MGTRRGNHEGTIGRRSDGRWEARITLADGKRKSFYGVTQQDVRKQLVKAQRDADQGLPVTPEDQTVAHYLAAWLVMIKPHLRPRVFDRYTDYVRLHLSPALGRHKLAKLSAQHVQTFYSERLDAGCSPTSVRHMHNRLRRALGMAVRLGLVQRNVCELVDPPRPAHPQLTVWSADEARTFLAANREEPWYPLWVLALTTGLRQSELLGLSWSAVDLAKRTLQVVLTQQQVKHGDGTYRFEYAAPKTARSRRLVALTKGAAVALRAHRVKQHERRLALLGEWQAHDLVFCDAFGRPLSRDRLYHHVWRPAVKRAGVPLIRFHDLRHTAATLLLGEGVHPKIVSEMLGHASIAITLDTYSHVLPDMQQVAVNAMEQVFSGDHVIPDDLQRNG